MHTVQIANRQKGLECKRESTIHCGPQVLSSEATSFSGILPGFQCLRSPSSSASRTHRCIRLPHGAVLAVLACLWQTSLQRTGFLPEA